MSDKEYISIVDTAIDDYHGDAHILSSAIGMLSLSRRYGWKVMYLIYDKKTIRKYENILNIDIRESFPEEGELAHRSKALKLMKKAGNFWKAVKGEIAGIRTPEITK